MLPTRLKLAIVFAAVFLILVLGLGVNIHERGRYEPRVLTNPGQGSLERNADAAAAKVDGDYQPVLPDAATDASLDEKVEKPFDPTNPLNITVVGSKSEESDEVEAEDDPDLANDASDLLTPDQHAAALLDNEIVHLPIYSRMTIDGRMFKTDFLSENGYNPNFIPHADDLDVWWMVAQRDKQHDDNVFWNTEIVCEARFINDTMTCLKPPVPLPIAATNADHCVADMSDWKDQIGPHDARVFYGPDAPYIVYMSQSNFNCLGQWIQDFRRITDWSYRPTTNVSSDVFFYPTNIQRPPPYRRVEKNWFLFWDHDGDMYVHYDVTADNTRVYSRLYANGSVSDDIALQSAEHDKQCMLRYMPKVRPFPYPEWVHQATNSLSLTLCDRADPTCEPTRANTVIVTLIQTKTFYYHGQYEPYLMLFRQEAPFELYGFTTVPFWYTGRGAPNDGWADGTYKPKDQSQMIFTTSLNWASRGQTYHGYLDDRVLIGFGVEDQASAGIDSTFGELLVDLATCDGRRDGQFRSGPPKDIPESDTTTPRPSKGQEAHYFPSQPIETADDGTSDSQSASEETSSANPTGSREHGA
ncbi:hypothetical protein PYCC9005_000452 [Savitreella phatthalungensis]